MKTRTSYVYGLFSPDATCLYVGISVSPRQRLSSHKATTMRGKDFSMRIIRKVSMEDAARIEGQVILAYRRRGEAQINGVVPFSLPTKVSQKFRVPAIPKSAALPQTKYNSASGIRVHIALPDLLWSRIRALAPQTIRTPSALVRHILKGAIQKRALLE